jgi:hypothetical protein
LLYSSWCLPSYLIQSINTGCCPSEHGLLFRFGKAGRHLLKGIPHHLVRQGKLIHRKIAFKHAALRSEAFHGVPIISFLNFDKFVRPRRDFSGMPAETVIGHGQPAELGENVFTFGDLGHILFPLDKDFFPFIPVGTYSQRGSEMIKDHPGFRYMRFVSFFIGRKGTLF